MFKAREHSCRQLASLLSHSLLPVARLRNGGREHAESGAAPSGGECMDSQLSDGKKHSCFDRILWTLLSVLPLLSVVLAEYIFIHYVENIAIAGSGEYEDWSGWDWQLTHICVFIMAASMMSKELLPAVHMMLWVWHGQRRDPGVQVKDAEPAEFTPLKKFLFFFLLCVGRLYMAVRFFNAAVGHITFSKEMEDQILNTTAMVFVLEIDEVILELTFSPEMINLLNQVPAVSGDLPGLANSLFVQSASIFVKSQFFQGCVRAFGVLFCAIYATWVWMTVPAEFLWEFLWLVHPAPYCLVAFTALGHKLASTVPHNTVQDHPSDLTREGDAAKTQPGKVTLPRKRQLSCVH